MAVAGRELFRWLAQPHILQASRTEFETLLLSIAEFAEEWLTSAQSIGVAKRMPTDRVLLFDYARNNDDGTSAGERAPLARSSVRPGRASYGPPRRPGGISNPQRR